MTEDRTHGALRYVLLLAGAAVALSSFYAAPRLTNQLVSGVQPGTAPGASGPGGNAAAAQPGKTAGQPSAGPAAATSGISCSGFNGGATDVGVTQHSINLAATEVESGVGASFLAPVRFGMLAVVQKVNREGGICGRQLNLTLKDDGWDRKTGEDDIRNFIDSNQYFALAVVPSSEGLDAASLAGDLDSAPDSKTGAAGIPVIGSDGMLNSQYTDPWIWPVAASTATSMRVIAHDAIKRGAKSFGLVYNGSYRFGVEGAGAFVAQLKREGRSINQNCIVKLDVSSGQQDYSSQVSAFNNACGAQSSAGGVDFVALLLEPQTAEAWLSGGPYMGHRANGSGYGAGGPQPLFDDGFGSNCGQICSQMEVWTSFHPPLYPYDQSPAVKQFKQDLAVVDSNAADADNAFTEGGYLGMELLVEALKRTPDLTRANLRATLNSLTFSSGLGGDLAFSARSHYANTAMAAFRDGYSEGSGFTGFQFVNGSQQTDPCVGCQDPPLG